MTGTEKAMRGLFKMNKVVSRAEETFIVLAMAALIIIIAGQVVCRYALKIPMPWAEESARYIYIYLGFVGSAYALFKNEHIDINLMDTFINKAKNPERIYRFYKKMISVVCILFFLFFLSTYFDFVSNIAHVGQYSAALKINMVIPMSSGIVGIGLMLFHCVSLLIIPEKIQKEVI